MPIYEFECTECGKRTERLQRLDDPPLAECPSCGGPVQKAVSAPAFQFKGSGWYVTDYARKDAAKSSGDDKKDSKKSSGDSSESGSSDKGSSSEKKAKSETKSSTKDS